MQRSVYGHSIPGYGSPRSRPQAHYGVQPATSSQPPLGGHRVTSPQPHHQQQPVQSMQMHHQEHFPPLGSSSSHFPPLGASQRTTREHSPPLGAASSGYATYAPPATPSYVNTSAAVYDPVPSYVSQSSNPYSMQPEYTTASQQPVSYPDWVQPPEAQVVPRSHSTENFIQRMEAQGLNPHSDPYSTSARAALANHHQKTLRSQRSQEGAAFLRIANAKQVQRQAEKQQPTDFPEPSQNQISNSMSIRELAGLVGQLPDGVDPFRLIYDNLRTPGVEPTAQTTLMIRNIPTRYTQRLFLREIIKQGFDRCIDFLYLPSDSRGKGNVGYGFLNFVTTGFLGEFKRDFDGSKFKHYPCTTGLTIIMSTTQGWKENLVKVIRNNVLKRHVAPEHLPLLFCRSTGQEYPFPVPSDIPSPEGTPLASGPYAKNSDRPEHTVRGHGTPPKVPREASGRFEMRRGRSFSPGSKNSSRNSSASRGRGYQYQEPTSSWGLKEFRPQAKEFTPDPLAGFAGNAYGEDAFSRSVSPQPEYSDFMYSQPQTSGGFQLGGADTAAFVPSSQQNYGRYSRGNSSANQMTPQETSADVSVNSWGDAVNPAPTKCKAAEFFAHHGLATEYDAEHISHVNNLKLAKGSTSTMKLAHNQPRFPIVSTFAKGKGKGKGKGFKGDKGGKPPKPSRAASSRSLAEIIASIPEPVEVTRSQSAKEFCAIDVKEISEERLIAKVRHSNSGISIIDRFNLEPFEKEEEAPATPQLQRLWSSASQNLEAFTTSIREGEGDGKGDDEKECCTPRDSSLPPPLFARGASTISAAAENEPNPELSPREAVEQKEQVEEQAAQVEDASKADEDIASTNAADLADVDADNLD